MNMTSDNNITAAVDRACAFFARHWNKFLCLIGDPVERPLSELNKVRLKFWNGTKDLYCGEKFEFHYESPDRVAPQQVFEEYEAAGWRVMGCLCWLNNADGQYALQWLEIRAPLRRHDLYHARATVKEKIPDNVLNPSRSWLNRFRRAI